MAFTAPVEISNIDIMKGLQQRLEAARDVFEVEDTELEIEIRVGYRWFGFDGEELPL